MDIYPHFNYVSGPTILEYYEERGVKIYGVRCSDLLTTNLKHAIRNKR